MFISASRSVILDVMDPNTVVERVPRLDRGFFDPMQELRKAKEEAAVSKNLSHAVGMTDKGTMQHLVTVPLSVWSAIEQLEPGFFSQRKNVYRLREEHPEYRVGKTVLR
jgi:hypothetical protein